MAFLFQAFIVANNNINFTSVAQLLVHPDFDREGRWFDSDHNTLFL